MPCSIILANTSCEVYPVPAPCKTLSTSIQLYTYINNHPMAGAVGLANGTQAGAIASLSMATSRAARTVLHVLATLGQRGHEINVVLVIEKIMIVARKSHKAILIMLE